MRAIVSVLAAWAALGVGPGALAADAPRCDRGQGRAVVIDDTVHTSAWTRDQMRLFRLEAPAQLLAPMARSSGCFDLLDPDPIFSQFSQAPRPELVVRVRVSDLRAAERGLGEKADLAVRRYLASYFGGSEADVPALRGASVSVEILCISTRRVALEAIGESNSEGGTAERNGDVFNEALRRAFENLVERLGAGPVACEAPAAAPLAGWRASGSAPAFPSP